VSRITYKKFVVVNFWFQSLNEGQARSVIGKRGGLL
jgi:hypothetical protein